MLKLLERNIAAIDERLVLLAPSPHAVPDDFVNVSFDTSLHTQLVREMQQLRGSVYLEDGAVQRLGHRPLLIVQPVEDHARTLPRRTDGPHWPRPGGPSTVAG